MCHPKFQWAEREESQETPPTNMQQFVAYNLQQWLYYNKLFAEVHYGIYGYYYHFLLWELYKGPYWTDINIQLSQVQRAFYYFTLGDLYEGPYWSDVELQLGQFQEDYEPEDDDDIAREPMPEDDSSSSDSASENE